jgi:hypothetical protein
MANITQIDPGIQQRLEAQIRSGSVGNIVSNSDFGVPRRPFFLTCELWLQGKSSRPSLDSAPGIPQLIRLPVNPSKVNFKIGLRQNEQRVRGGRILHVWKNRDRRSFLDEPVMTFNFQAGNILSTSTGPGGALVIAKGLKAFWNFMRLIDEEKIIPPSALGGVPTNIGDPNYVIIEYSSKKFPLIRLKGFFREEGVDFDDDSANPLTLDWTSSFTVYDSTPRFSDAADLNAAFLGEGDTFLKGVPLKTDPGAGSTSPDREHVNPSAIPSSAPPAGPVGSNQSPLGASPAPQVGAGGPTPNANPTVTTTNPNIPVQPNPPVGSSFVGAGAPPRPGR